MFNDWYEGLLFMIVVFVSGLIVFACGAAHNEPEKLENDCIVHNNKVYCEVSNIGKGEWYGKEIYGFMGEEQKQIRRLF